MPGIVALITRMPRAEAVSQLMRMVESLCHEAFYTHGTWIDEPLGVYVGWVARAGSFCEQMPLRNRMGNVVLAFSGEEFRESAAAGVREERRHFPEESGSYLVDLYEDDPSFPKSLNGRFHGLLADRSLGAVTVFNDRFGMHRLYFHQSADGFYLAAEAKAILAVRPELRQLDSHSAGEFVSCGAVLGNKTLFKGIEVLPQAAKWIFRGASLEQKITYFDPREWENQEKLDPEAFYQQLHAALTRNLPHYFQGSQKIGMSLTGGLDSRVILASRRPAPDTLPCYTFGSMMREHQDVRVARKVADACGQPFQILVAGKEFLDRFRHYAERTVYLTDGCVDVGRSPDLYLSERAREIAPVRITGTYGGEIMRGVSVFKPVEPPVGLYSREFLEDVHGAAQRFVEMPYDNPISFAAFQLTPWLLYGVLALEQTQLTMRSPFLDNEFVQTMYRAPATALANNDVTLRLIADGNKKLLDIATDRGIGGNRGRLWESVSRGLLEFLFKAEYAYDMGMPQWLARFDHAVSPLHLERLFLGRHKPFHFRVWYRDALADAVRDMLLDSRSLSRSYIDRKGLESIVEGHLRGDRNYTNDLHKVLTLELTHRQFIDADAQPVLSNVMAEPKFSAN